MDSSTVPVPISQICEPYSTNHPQSQTQQHSSPFQNQPSHQQYQPMPAKPTDQPTPLGQYSQTGSYFPVSNGSEIPGIDPAAAAAAVAVLSQLTQITANIDPAGAYGPGANHSSVGRLPYRGGGKRGGRRGGRAFRGNKKGNFDHQEGQHNNSVNKGNPRTECLDDVDNKLTTEENKPAVTGEAETASIQYKIAKIQPGPQHAWCDLCKVSCTSLETFEQHKIGKRHQKNLRKMLGSETNVQPVNGVETETKGPQLQVDALQGNCNKVTEPIPPEISGSTSKTEIEPRNDALECPQGTVESSQNLQANNQSIVGTSGMKRKLNDKKGGKPSKKKNKIPKVVIPLMCDLCNVKCDTQEVLNRHLSGKKHLSKFKRFQGHKAMYGQVGLQALYPPNPMAQTALQSQGYQQPSFGPQESTPPSENNAPHLSATSASNGQTEPHNSEASTKL